ncbi:hypothetical protein PR048_024796 [Dryococelus australis]|uniref:Uncharacterized protein n=1 Tax=Dryococelus australis TaxID=614101 RepID=A0ABQ9GPK1_9NEOP|nr:hypothetical protein PR048_024796 [Dryococelus australis]
MHSLRGEKPSRVDLDSLLTPVWLSTFIPQTIINSFSKTGIFPLTDSDQRHTSNPLIIGTPHTSTSFNYSRLTKNELSQKEILRQSWALISTGCHKLQFNSRCHNFSSKSFASEANSSKQKQANKYQEGKIRGRLVLRILWKKLQ